MVRRKKAKVKPFTSNLERKAEDVAMTAQSEASASSPSMTGTTMEDGSNNEEDAKEVGGNEDIRMEVSPGEENANGEGPGQSSVVIVAETMNSGVHSIEEVGDEKNVNEKCLVEDFDNFGMEAMNCDVYANEVLLDEKIMVESFNMHNEVDEWFVTPTEETEVKVLAVENASAGCLGDCDAPVTVGDGVGEINEENTPSKENCGEYANKDEDRIADEEEEDENEEEEDEEEYGEEENNLVDEVEEENDQIDEMDDAHLEEEIHGDVLNKNGDEEDVVGKGNSQGIDNGNKNDVAGEVNCEGVVKEQKEEEVEKMAKQKIKRSRKRIRTSTSIASSAGNLVLNKKIGEDVPNIDHNKISVAYGNKGKQKVGMHVKGSGGEKVQVNTEKEVGESSLKKRKRSKQKGGSSFLAKESLVEAASETEGKSGLKNKKNGLLKSETKGMIFMCSSKTKSDCYRYMVLGLPAGKKEMVENIFKGMTLFLYDVDKKLLYGIYQAAAHGGYEIEKEAFNSKFPAQVRFEILEDCLPLEEKKFSKVIRDNYYTRNKFDCQLNSVQVENLCKLFHASIKDVKSERRTSRADRGFGKVREREREKRKLKTAPIRFAAERRKERLPPARKERHHPEHRLVHNEVASLPRRPVRLSQATTSSYAYERSLNREVFRGEPSVPHSEIYRRQQLEPRDPYRRELLLDRRDTYSPDPYIEHSGTYRQEPLLVPRDSYRVEQPPLRPRDSYLQYPVLERRDYDLDPLVGRRDYNLEPLVERRDYESLPGRRDAYRGQSPLLDHQDLYREDPVLERQNLRRLNLEARHPNVRGREDAFSRQDHLVYSGGVYSVAQPLRATMVPESQAVGLTTTYPSSADSEPPRYYFSRPVYRL